MIVRTLLTLMVHWESIAAENKNLMIKKDVQKTDTLLKEVDVHIQISVPLCKIYNKPSQFKSKCKSKISSVNQIDDSGGSDDSYIIPDNFCSIPTMKIIHKSNKMMKKLVKK